MSSRERQEDVISATDRVPNTISKRPEATSALQLAETAVYTTFTHTQKRLLTCLLGFATITSPLTATIYFPLLPLLREHFSTSAQAINLTITLYVVFQALSPAIFGPLSDTLGRRPVYIITLLVYCAANIGLAANKHSYAVLLALRAFQSLGASASFAVSYGVVADVCVPSERGRMLGPLSMALNLGACIGPVVGGCVAYTSGSYEWVFWALVIVGCVLLLLVGLLFPETARSLVGNGSDRVNQAWWETSWLEVILRSRKRHSSPTPLWSPASTPRKTLEARFRLANPLLPLLILLHRDTFLSLWMHASFYVVDYAMVTVLPDIFQGIYGWNSLQTGLAYLPRGIGIISGGYVNGKVMDHNYRTVARQHNFTVDRVRGDDLFDFPIEEARSRRSPLLLLISTATLVGYGWAATSHAHISILLILQFIQGFWGTCFYTTYNALVVDVFPESPSTAAAAASILRCAMAAAGVAMLQPLLEAVGRGWYFTALGLWSGMFGIAAVWLMRNRGMQWRQRRLNREREKKAQRGGGSMQQTQAEANAAILDGVGAGVDVVQKAGVTKS